MIAAAPGASSRTGWLRTCSNDSGAARKPRAEAAPDAGGISTCFTPSTRPCSRMHRSRTAETNHRVGTRVLAFLHYMDAGGSGHVLRHQAMDATRRVNCSEAQLFPDLRQRVLVLLSLLHIILAPMTHIRCGERLFGHATRLGGANGFSPESDGDSTANAASR